MSKVHLLNVKNGDCTIIEHASERRTMIDISAGNIQSDSSTLSAIFESAGSKPRGNFGMCRYPTNPIAYLQSTLNTSSLFRFILTHPDMDHLDGFNSLADQISISHFWDNGARKSKPEFSGGSPYKEEDWDRYVRFRDNREEGANTITPLAGDKFSYANHDEQGPGGDGLYILAPDQGLVDEANKSEDFNDCSYVILYKSNGGNVIIAGDAHDKTWDYILENHSDDIKDCKFLLAPHHGRKSGRDYSFLDIMQPKLTLFGCARSEHLAYSAWDHRGLSFHTQNQCGNVVLETRGTKLDVYIENETYAEKIRPSTFKNTQGYCYITTL